MAQSMPESSYPNAQGRFQSGPDHAPRITPDEMQDVINQSLQSPLALTYYNRLGATPLEQVSLDATPLEQVSAHDLAQTLLNRMASGHMLKQAMRERLHEMTRPEPSALQPPTIPELQSQMYAPTYSFPSSGSISAIPQVVMANSAVETNTQIPGQMYASQSNSAIPPAFTMTTPLANQPQFPTYPSGNPGHPLPQGSNTPNDSPMAMTALTGCQDTSTIAPVDPRGTCRFCITHRKLWRQWNACFCRRPYEWKCGHEHPH